MHVPLQMVMGTAIFHNYRSLTMLVEISLHSVGRTFALDARDPRVIASCKLYSEK
jgi:hypothetical protein